MELFNNKVLMTTDLYPPQFSFNADEYTLRFDLMDERDFSKIKYTLNGKEYNVIPSKSQSYRDPDIDPIYDTILSLTYTIYPNNQKYRSATHTVPIYYNNLRCKDFRYGDEYGTDDKTSSSMYKYIGTLPLVYIPDKHNLIDTTWALLNEFPYVEGDELSLRIGAYITHLDLIKDGLKDQRFKAIYNSSRVLNPIPDQFSDLSNLEEISGQYFRTVNHRMFKNCPKLYMDPRMTSEITSFNNKTEVFYNTPSLNRVILNVTSIPSGEFDYSSSYTGYPDYQKIIFTQENSINGFTAKELALDSFTDGMAYTNPETNQLSKHQVFVDLDLNWWDTALTPLRNDLEVTSEYNYLSSDLTNGVIHIHCNDSHVLGFKIKAKNSSKTSLKGALMWIPKNLRKSSGNVRDDYRESNDFYLSASHLYNIVSSDVTVTPSGNNTITIGMSMGGSINRLDKLEITPISCDGLSATTFNVDLIPGEIDNQPSAAPEVIAYTGNRKGRMTLNYNGATLNFAEPQYELWFTVAPELVDRSQIEMRTLLYQGSNFYGYRNIYATRFGNGNLYFINLLDAYPDDIGSSYDPNKKLDLSYAGWSEPKTTGIDVGISMARGIRGGTT